MKSTLFHLSGIAALILVSSPQLAWPQKHLLTTVQAIDEDRRGILADVVRIFGDGREEWLAKTNQKGIAAFTPAISCDFNHRIRVRPDAPLRYQQPEYQKCGKSLSFLVRRWVDVKEAIMDAPDRKIVESLWDQAELLEDEKNLVGLPLIYTELSVRLEWTKSPLVKQLREQAYSHTAKALKVTNGLTFDDKQEMSVMSPRMIVTLKEFQREKNLDTTGRLDRATLQFMAKKPYSYFLYDYARPLAIGGPDVELQPSEIIEAIAILTNLEANALTAIFKGDHSLALMLYAEMTQRYWRLGKIKEGRASERKTYEEAAEVLRIIGGAKFDPVQNKYVMSTELVAAIKEYQEKRELSINGRLDYRTLQELSGRALSPYLYGVTE